jgi:CheY-like chemotaxis protein
VVTADKANHQFWSNVSHELRTPLNSILGYTELLLEASEVLRNKSVLSDIEKVKTAGHELLALVNDVLSVSGIDEEEFSHHNEVIEVGELVENVIAVMQPLAQRNGIELNMSVPSGSQAIKVDARKLERLLLALLTNTIKSTGEGLVSFSLTITEPPAPSIAIKIRDTGPGVAPDQLEALSKPYASTNEAEHTALRSTNLTLAACKKLVHELGGTIVANNEPGLGNCYLVTLPVAIETERDSRVAAESDLNPDILVIDEFDDSAELLARYLKRLSCKVTVSNDGADGKEIAVLLQPDLIILDVDMRSIDGWAVLQHLKFDSRTRNIPVILSSVRNVLTRARDQGAQACLIKPVSATAVQKTIDRLPEFRSDLEDKSNLTALPHESIS